jgi:serine/threonine-protein kinase
MQAWMPESIAAYKLRGFIHDAGGEVVDTNKSRIRVLLGGRNCAYRSTNGKASWLGFGGSKQDIELELQLWQATNARQNNLWVTVILRYLGRAFDSDWRNRAEQVFRDLRAYLIGTTAAVAK